MKTPIIISIYTYCKLDNENKIIVDLISSFYDIYSNHKSTDWLVSKNKDFNDLEFKSLNNENNLTNISFELDKDTKYFCKVRYNVLNNLIYPSNEKIISTDWSPTIEINTNTNNESKKIETPVIDKSNIEVFLTGNFNIIVNQTNNFIIVNYNKDIDYKITVEKGSIEIHDDLIKYTAPNLVCKDIIMVLGKQFNINITQAIICKPIIIFPKNNNEHINKELTIKGNEFKTIGIDDIHVSSSFQLSKDPNFTNLVLYINNSTLNLTNWVCNSLSPDTNYYIRIKYKGKTLGDSEWSDVIKFTTKSKFVTIDVTGPRIVIVNTKNVYKINNYDNNFIYKLYADKGSIIKNNDEIIFTAPEYPCEAIINVSGTEINIIVEKPKIDKPNIISPDTGSTGLGPSITFISSDFISLGLNDSHVNSSWQISTNVTFTDIIEQVIDDIINLINFTSISLKSNTIYYIRVKYKGTVLGYSEWSDISSFKTKQTFINISIIGPQSLVINTDGIFTINNYNKAIEYNIKTDLFRADRIDNTIKVVAPYTTGLCNLTINDTVFHIDIIEPKVMTPGIKSPLNLEENVSDHVFITGSDFITNNEQSIHESTEWEILLNNIIPGTVINTSINLTKLAYYGLKPNTEYKVRVRYKSNLYGYSDWSQYTSFTTKKDFMFSHEIQKLTNKTNIVNSLFGTSIAINSNGNISLISSLRNCVDNKITGAVDVYKRKHGLMEFLTRLTPDIINNDNNYGYSLAISDSGNIIAIGAYSDIYDNIKSGIVYIYNVIINEAGYSIELVTKISPIDKINGLEFGKNIDISGDGKTLIIGAPGWINHENKKLGAFYICDLGNKIYPLNGPNYLENLTENSMFGNSVTINKEGTVISIGAYNDSNKKGSGFIYKLLETSWVLDAKLIPSCLLYDELLGYCAKLSDDGNILLLSAPNRYTGNYGSIYLFKYIKDDWVISDELKPNIPITNNVFGKTIEITNDNKFIVVGSNDRIYIFKLDKEKYIEYNVISINCNNIAINNKGTVCLIANKNDSVDGVLNVGSVYLFK